MKRRDFLKSTTGMALAAGAAPILAAAKAAPAAAEPADDSLKIRFLGTGAAGGRGKSGKGRRHSSILVDDSFIIDFIY